MAFWQICGSTAPIVIKHPPAIEMFFKVKVFLGPPEDHEVLASCGLRTMATPPVGPWDINESSTAGANLAATWLKVQKTQVESQPSMQYACQLFAKHWKTATCLPGFLVVFRWMCICLPDSNGGVINEDNHLMSLLRT